MFTIPEGFERIHLLYGVLFALPACLIFGFAALLEPARPTPVSVRRSTTPLQWLARLLTGVFVPLEGGGREQLRRWLLQAGYDAPGAVGIYFALRLLAAVLVPAALLFSLPLYVSLPPNMLMPVACGAAISGFLAPVWLVRTRRVWRQRRFREGLPDMLDLLLICSEAGLGLDMAILTVGEEIVEAHPLLAEQLRQMSTELRAGLERREAMRSFADRTGIDETISLANLLIQSDELGTGMAQTLRAFSEDMRAHRMLKAEEQGHKVSVKLTLVLVLFFLPAIFAAGFVPVLFSAVKSLQGISMVQP